MENLRYSREQLLYRNTVFNGYYMHIYKKELIQTRIIGIEEHKMEFEDELYTNDHIIAKMYTFLLRFGSV